MIMPDAEAARQILKKSGYRVLVDESKYRRTYGRTTVKHTL